MDTSQIILMLLSYTVAISGGFVIGAFSTWKFWRDATMAANDERLKENKELLDALAEKEAELYELRDTLEYLDTVQ